MEPPVVVAWGAGRDSTAMLIEMHRRGVRPDAILFANTGSEKQETYRFIPVFGRWLLAHGFPPVTVVQYRPVSAPYRSLEGNMVLNATLPGATFNIGSCTAKFKVQPQNRWTEGWPPAWRAWAAGRKVVKLIGFEAGEGYRLDRADARAHAGLSNPRDGDRYEYRFPLMEWGYDLPKCLQVIEDARLPIPPKSACFFCPNQRPAEVHGLSEEERARAILMEVAAEPYNRQVRGLWRRPRGSDGRPGSITEYVLQQKLPFTPLTRLGKQIALNPACGKARTGTHTFSPPHVGPTLRELLKRAGHRVPEVVPADAGAGRDAYREDWRRVSGTAMDGVVSDAETDQHLWAAQDL